MFQLLPALMKKELYLNLLLLEAMKITPLIITLSKNHHVANGISLRKNLPLRPLRQTLLQPKKLKISLLASNKFIFQVQTVDLNLKEINPLTKIPFRNSLRMKNQSMRKYHQRSLIIRRRKIFMRTIF